MRYLAFYLGIHDSNVCLYDSQPGRFSYVQFERITGIKRHWANWDMIERYCEDHNFVPDVVCFSDGDRNGLGECPPDATHATVPQGEKPAFADADWLNVDHHMAHVMSAWPLIATDTVDYGIAIDGRGDHERRVSIFQHPSRLESPIYTTTESRVGHLFDNIGLAMNMAGHKADFAGKLMGAQGYGEPDVHFAQQKLSDGIESDLFSLLRLPAWEGRKLDPSFFTFDNPSFRNWLATVHLISSRVIEHLFERNFPKSAQIIYSGGCAMNTVINQEIAASYPHVVIPPHCSDGGLSLGCLEVARIVHDDGPVQLSGFPFVQHDENMGFAGTAVIDRAAEALARGEIVGWLQGNGEIGPRALGHRSLLMNPALADGKDQLNARVKHREGWRPFGPAVLHLRQRELFDTDLFRPFMLHGVCATQYARAMIPAVVHVDGSSRIQSVDSRQMDGTSTFGELIDRFSQLTGVPALLNTSYNAGGKPIVGFRDQALSFFHSTGIDALVLGNDYFERDT